MERIFANLYRFSDGPRGPAKKMSYTYLLVRKQGNLLIRHWGLSSVFGYLDAIEELGGIDQQFVAHHHDAKRGDLHARLHARCGCKLNYHQAERRAVRIKTKCPEQEYGDEGLQLGSDFEAHFFPGHTAGMSIFHWRNRGKHFLFPSHVIQYHNDEWYVQFDPLLMSNLHAQFADLATLPVDYLLPGASAGDKEPIHQFTDSTRKLFHRTLRAKLNPR